MICTKIQSASEFYSTNDVAKRIDWVCKLFTFSRKCDMFPINCIWINGHCSSPIICYHHNIHTHTIQIIIAFSMSNARYATFHFCRSATMVCIASRVKIFTCQLKCVRTVMEYGTQSASNPFTRKFNLKTHYYITIHTQFCGGARL